MSAYLTEVGREAARAAGSGWLSVGLTVLVVALAVALLLQRELVRGGLSEEREQRVRLAAGVVVPLLLCAGLALGARLLELLT